MIRVLVVEDSPVVKELLVHILDSDPAIEVAGTASNGEEAVEAAGRIKPDIITMDIHMPKMNGLDASRRIMETNPTPIVVVTGTYDPAEVSTTFRALESGALAVVPKPTSVGHTDHHETCAELLRTVKAMSEVKVVRRWAKPSRPAAAPVVHRASDVELKPPSDDVKVIVIGASTGGPLALQTILSELPEDFGIPILVVQHIAPGFIRGFGEWLDRTTKLRVGLATDGERILPGRIYLAPDGLQMQVLTQGRISLVADEPENGLRPSVSSLFRSVAKVYGQHAVGVLLTGMGKDGAEELRLMKLKGAVTIAQDEESSVVYGMPGEAARLGGATYVFSSGRIAGALLTLVHHREMAQ
jgi:two-component system, chemotaxis family, protein-glutamate methylesterase/glutaminase